MTRQRWILDPKTGKLVDADQYHAEKANGGPIVIGDIKQPFVSMADGKTVIHSKAQYRDHLRQHGCRVVGSDTNFGKKQIDRNVAAPLRDIWNNRHSADALRNIAESGKIRD